MKNEKIPVAILGATGLVGQTFVQLLQNHPWYEIKELGASPSSCGKKYNDAVTWLKETPIPEVNKHQTVVHCSPDAIKSPLLFSGLDSTVAETIEQDFYKNGRIVVSNSRNHRMNPQVPLLVPEINPEHLNLLDRQNPGKIITNPNCSVSGLVMALKPLDDSFGVTKVHVVTLQSISGAGYPGVASLSILDNIIPYIGGEEDEKIEQEPCKILGGISDLHPMKISAHANRVPVTVGHTLVVSVQLKHSASKEQIVNAWNEFKGLPQKYNLPSAPKKPIYYFEEIDFPQPQRHKNLESGMAIAIGRLRACPLLGWKFVVTVNNLIRGACGGSILNAELLYTLKSLPK